MKKLKLILFISAAVFSCSVEKTQDCQTLECYRQIRYDSVIAIHDEVMPKLSTIASLQKELQEAKESETDSSRIVLLDEAMMELQDADEAMWVWMRQFKFEMDTTATQGQLDYLSAQKKSAELMADKIKKAIGSAQELLLE